ncbi:hypothetical protein JXM67_02255 [candidate division WOR-3 bacterium]|nr:hypothetical protein [candidate division WOR-3 bacterium]
MAKKLILGVLTAIFFLGFAGCTPELVPVEVTITSSYGIDTNEEEYIEFTYNFNQDVILDSVHVMIPTISSPYEPQGQTGSVEGETDNSFRVYWEGGLPSGTWTIYLWGVAAEGDETFDFSEDFDYLS